MSLILQPQKDYPIVRQIANHLDSATYYVQAVVRDADGTTIATVQLEDKGGQRFQKRYRVPVDASGQGAYISIVTSVYTDSGYTSKSPNYGDEETTYLIFDRVTGSRGGGGGGNIDSKTIRRIVSEELEKVKPEEKEELEIEPPQPMRWAEVLSAIDEVGSKIDQLEKSIIKIPTKLISLEPITTGLAEIKQMIVEKEVTPETDLTPVYEEMDILNEEVTGELLSHRLFLQEIKTDLTDTITKTVKDAVDNTEFVTDFQVKPKRTQQNIPQPEQPAYDINKLAS